MEQYTTIYGMRSKVWMMFRGRVCQKTIKAIRILHIGKNLPVIQYGFKIRDLQYPTFTMVYVPEDQLYISKDSVHGKLPGHVLKQLESSEIEE